jgi:23S rRNA (adenine2503-C2)-methyltransferase
VEGLVKNSIQQDLRDLTQEEIVAYVERLGHPAFRGRQIMSWLYRPGITTFDQMTDLAKDFRRELADVAYISRFTEPITQLSEDGCVKFGFTLDDGHIIESVLIPEPDRNTLCISSQVGCAMGCSFCQTATMGFIRNLSRAEIVNQVCSVRDYLLAQPRSLRIGPERVTNLVYMGMGEPLNNLANVIASISILTEPKGLDLAARKITVSTCGIVSRMHELGEKTTINLAISLHSVRDEVRDKLMPVNRKYPVKTLLAACKTFPMPRRKRIMFEYTLLKGINDSDDDARELARALRDVPCKINLLPYNSSPGLGYVGSNHERILAFQQILLDSHYTVFVRTSRGRDIAAACGQLATSCS